MSLIDTNNQIRFSTVGISDINVSEYDQESPKVTIPVAKITKISLEYGSPVERPLSNILVCVVLLGIGITLGIWPLYAIFSNGDIPSSIYSFKIFVMAVPLVALGGWFFLRFFQKRYFLKIETDTDTRKIVFESSKNKQDIIAFIKNAKRKFGVKIEL